MVFQAETQAKIFLLNWAPDGQFAFTSDPTDNLPRSLEEFELLGENESWFFNLAEKRVLSYWEADAIMKLLDEYADDCDVDWSVGYQDVPGGGGVALHGPQEAASGNGWKMRCLLALAVGIGIGFFLQDICSSIV